MVYLTEVALFKQSVDMKREQRLSSGQTLFSQPRNHALSIRVGPKRIASKSFTLMLLFCLILNGLTPFPLFAQMVVNHIDLASLVLPQGFPIVGATAGGQLGYSVSSAGDVNKDGYADLIIGAPQASPSGRSSAGISYVVYGNTNLANLDLDNLIPSQGFSIAGNYGAGVYNGGQSGWSVSGAGDVNKDGYDDVVIVDREASPYGRAAAGAAHVIYGGPNLTNIDLANLTYSQGFSIAGSGVGSWSASGAGDVNKDGYADVIIGSPYDRKSYIIYGSINLIDIDLANFVASRGVAITGTIAGGVPDFSGASVSGAGDVNKDGYADVIIGAPYAASYAGISYVIYGKPNLTNLNLATLTSTQGFSIQGVTGGSSNGDYVGSSVSDAGDLNGDGYADVIIGAGNVASKAGVSYVVYGSATSSNIALASLTQAQGISISGGCSSGGSGWSVSGAGDLNNDGYSDVIIGAPGAVSCASMSYGILGGRNLTNLNLASLLSTQGFPIGTSSTSTNAGFSVNGVGDFNNDGYSDVIIGANLASPGGRKNAGTSYVVLGGISGFNTTMAVTLAQQGVFELSSLTYEGGFSTYGPATPNTLNSALASGDINGDGVEDMIVGASGASPDGRTYAGQAYIVYGKQGGFPSSTLNLTSLNASTGLIINGIKAYDWAGYSVAAGDVNGDDIADILIGAPNGGSNAGQLYVVYGQQGGFSNATINLSSLPASTGFIINGANAFDAFGWATASGDINGDGIMDIITGAPCPFGSTYCCAGHVYVIYGQQGGFSNAMINLSSLTASTGLIINGIGCASNSPLGDQAGSGVATADINGDGISDVLIGAPFASSRTGQAYVVYGKKGGFSYPTLNCSSLTTSSGLIINGMSQYAYGTQGLFPISSGDINNDHVADVLIGGYGASPGGLTSAGQTYVVYGQQDGFSYSNFNLSALDTSTGLVINGINGAQQNLDLGGYGDQAGYAIASGDANGDGVADILIGARFASPEHFTEIGQSYRTTKAGQSYIVYGKQGGFSFPAFNLSSLTPLTGLTINGVNVNDGAGFSIFSGKDINGDGGQGTLIGTQSGYTYLIYGKVPLATTPAIVLTTTPTKSTMLPTSTTLPTTASTTQTTTSVTLASTTTSSTLTLTAGTTLTMTVQPTTSTTAVPTTVTTAATFMTQSLTSTMPSTVTTMNAPTAQLATPTTTIPPTTTTGGLTETANVSSTSFPTAMNTNTTAERVTTTEETLAPIPASSTSQSTTVLSLTTSPFLVSNITSTTSFNATLQSGGRTTSSASSWTGTIIGVTVGAVAAIGAGYLAYRKWRDHGKGIAPQTKGAAIAAMNAMDSAHEEGDVRMRTNPVYEENSLQQAPRRYEEPHIDTWDLQAYDVAEPEGPMAFKTVRRGTYDVLDAAGVTRAYEAPHVTTWSPQAYDFVDGSYRPPAYETVLAPQQPWNSEGYETGPFGVSDL